MEKSKEVELLKEDWSAFELGHLHRDCTARGEYMAMTVPPNPHGWRHNSNLGFGASIPGKTQNQSPFKIIKTLRGKALEMPAAATAPAVILTTGEKLWRDYTVSAEVLVKTHLPVGVVARYRTNRDYYSASFESGIFKLILVVNGISTVLDSAPLEPDGESAIIYLDVSKNRIVAGCGDVRLETYEGSITSGGIGLWANGPSQFGKIRVVCNKSHAWRIETEARQREKWIGMKRQKIPAMELIADISVKGHAVGRQIRFADVNGDGKQELIFGTPTNHKGKKWTYSKLARLSVLDLAGNVLWERGSMPPDAKDITADLPFQAADRGNGMEVVASFGWDLEILDAKTGKVKQKTRTPKPPKMEDYWDEISQFFGDGHGDDLPYLIPDSIRLCNFTGRHAYGDILVKDRYHCVWALNGRTLKALWNHRCNTGHYPFAADVNDDGRDEMICGYTRLDSAGNRIGRLFLGDHPDACFTYLDHHGIRHNLHPSGEAGLIDETSDWRVEEIHLGHVQHLSIAKFVPNLPDLQRIVVTYHHNEGIIALLDCDDRILRKTEAYGAGAVCQPVNWTGDGRELIAFSPRHGDGGLWDYGFDLVVPFPDDNRPGKYMEVHDVLGWGIDQIIVWDENRLRVYAPKVRTKPGKKIYAPIKPETNLSNYQVNYSLPKWK